MIYLVCFGTIALVFGLMGFAFYILHLEYCGTDLYKVLESKLPERKLMSRAERRSRARVRAIVKSDKTPIQKCVALDAEMANIRTNLAISMYWKRIVESLFKSIMNDSKLTLRSNRRGGTYIASKINKGEFSKCLQVY
jgi:hypothetical protein